MLMFPSSRPGIQEGEKAGITQDTMWLIIRALREYK
jgi:hypothetical protein